MQFIPYPIYFEYLIRQDPRASFRTHIHVHRVRNPRVSIPTGPSSIPSVLDPDVLFHGWAKIKVSVCGVELELSRLTCQKSHPWPLRDAIPLLGLMELNCEKLVLFTKELSQIIEDER